MKKSELVVIANVLEKLAKVDSASVKFKYAIARNIKIVAPIVAPIIEMRDSIAKDFDEKRIALCKKYCAKNESGEPILEGDNFTGLAGNVEFETEFAELGKGMKVKFDEIQQIVDEEEDVVFYKIKIADIPNEVTTEMFVILEPLITE